MAITHRCLADARESSCGVGASPAWRTTRTMTGSCASDSSGDIGYTLGAARPTALGRARRPAAPSAWTGTPCVGQWLTSGRNVQAAR